MSDSDKRDPQIQEQEMRQYWLGELPSGAERRLEKTYFADDELFERMLAVKEELFDAYARGELSETQRRHFEQRLLTSPSAQAELEFARAFTSTLDGELAARGAGASEPTVSRTARYWWSFPRLVWTLGCAALLIGIGWLTRDNLQLRNQLAHLQAERATHDQRTRELEAQLAQVRAGNVAELPTPPPAPATSSAPPETSAQVAHTLAVTLSAVRLRSAGGDTVRLKPETRTLRFKLLLDAPDAFSRYQVALRQNGRGLRSWQNLRPTRKNGIGLLIELPATQLSANEYSFELLGINADGTTESAGRYPFRLVKP